MTNPIDELIKQAFQRIEYDNGQVHECYEFTMSEMRTLIDEIERLREVEWRYKDLCQ